MQKCDFQKVALQQNGCSYSLREKCPNMELFLVRVQSEYRKIRTRNNSVFGQFSRSESYQNNFEKSKYW